LSNRSSDDVLAVSAAARHEHYDGFGDRLVPQFGMEWRPLRPLLIRAAYSESFRAPRLSALFAQPVSSIGLNIIDRRRGESYQVSGVSGGRPDLDPETGRSRSAGIAWRDRRFSADATYWTVLQKNRVNAPAPQVLMDNEAFFPERVIRGPSVDGVPGRVTLLDRTFLNFGELSARGIDVRASASFDTPVGAWKSHLAATRMLEFDAAITPTTPTVDRLSKASTDAYAPRWKGTAGIGWRLGTLSANLSARYTGRYTDFDGVRDLGDFTLFDVHADYELGQLLGRNNRYVSGMVVSVGAINLLNRLPDFSNNFLGYDATQYDLRGRFIHADVRIKW
jgi:iron complex outermembrane receptor protein